MSRTATRKFLGALLGGVVLAGVTAAAAPAQLPSTTDPRANLAPGMDNAETASLGMRLLAHANKPAAHAAAATEPVFAIAGANSDMAFQGNYAFVGNFNGFTIYDISNPSAPVEKTVVVCPGGQGDLSVYENLLFMSVEETRAKKDCTLTPAATTATRFRGVRIFDISNINAPGPGRRRPDVPRQPHAHARRGQGRPEQRLHLRVGHVGHDRPDRRPDDLRRRSGDEPEPVAVADRGHQGPARAPETRGDRQRAAAVPQRGRRGQRPAERAADAAASVRERHAACLRREQQRRDQRRRVAAGPGHELLPRHHGLREVRHRGRLVRGQRHPDRHLRTRPTRSGSTRSPTRTTPTGTGRRSPTTARRSSSPTSGAAAPTRAAARPTTSSGAATRSMRSSTASWSSAATTSCRWPRRPAELRQPHPVAGADPRPRHHGPGLVPGRRVADRLHRRIESEGDRLLRPRPDRADRDVAGWLLVDVPLQRRDLRLGDPARLRRVRVHADRGHLPGRAGLRQRRPSRSSG